MSLNLIDFARTIFIHLRILHTKRHTHIITNRKHKNCLISGGAIIEKNVVATAAHCVDGLRTHDVLIKAGEWKLGSTEEPKPFQLIRVKQITMHPAYQPTNLESDVALLHLENNLNFDKHIGPICVDESELEPAGTAEEECVTSGWGKEIIKCMYFCFK